MFPCWQLKQYQIVHKWIFPRIYWQPGWQVALFYNIANTLQKYKKMHNHENAFDHFFARYGSRAGRGNRNSSKIEGACVSNIGHYWGRVGNGSDRPKIVARNSNKSEEAFISNIPWYNGGDCWGFNRQKSVVLVIVIARYGGGVDHGVRLTPQLLETMVRLSAAPWILHSTTLGPTTVGAPKLCGTLPLRGPDVRPTATLEKLHNKAAGTAKSTDLTQCGTPPLHNSVGQLKAAQAIPWNLYKTPPHANQPHHTGMHSPVQTVDTGVDNEVL